MTQRSPDNRLGSSGEENDTPFDGSGLKIKTIKTRKQLNEAEFDCITRVTEKYLLSKPSRKLAPFTFDWLMQHDMPATMWPDTNLRVTASPIRDEYIAAIKQADLRNLSPLIDLHKRYQEPR